jgi:hypothetical protein
MYATLPLTATKWPEPDLSLAYIVKFCNAAIVICTNNNKGEKKEDGRCGSEVCVPTTYIEKNDLHAKVIMNPHWTNPAVGGVYFEIATWRHFLGACQLAPKRA